MVRLDVAEALARRFSMLPDGVYVLAAVSGGVDSISLLHWLHTRGVHVAAGHLHHGLRGAAADEDEAFVRNFCALRGIPFYAGHVDVGALAQERGVSTEEAGRVARYDFLERTAAQIGADRIATAHHADDNAETLLFQLIRGARSGLGGIAPVRSVYIRPFLGVTRAQIEDYAAENGLTYRLDAMNFDDTFSRNYLRHEVMPRLKNLNTAAALHIAQTAQTLRAESEYLDALARERLYAGGATFTQTRVTAPTRVFADAPEVLRTRMVRLLLDTLDVGKKDFTARHYAAIESLCVSPYGSHLDLPRCVMAECRGGVLVIQQKNKMGERWQNYGK